jgi:hypothetical protein
MRRSSLAPEKMGEAQLWTRLQANCLQIANFGFDSTKASEVRAKGQECYRIAAELKSRGTQLSLAPELRQLQ